MDDDLQNLQLDRPGRGKTQEQIKKHTVDSQFENKPIERSVYLLTNLLMNMDPETIETISRAVTSALTAALAGPSSSATPVVPTGSCQNNDSEEEFEKVEELKMMLGLKLPIAKIARYLGLSRPTVYRLMHQHNLQEATKYSDITDNQLDDIIRLIKKDHPAAGQVILQGHLRARGIYIQRYRVRRSLGRVDANGIERRSLFTIRRRTYRVKGPNFLWHIDGTHKLIRWRLVVHACVDGFSRLLTFVQCSNNNKADTVLQLFNKSCEKYGNPLRVRTDAGGENVAVWERMRELYADETRPVIVGSSVHNQRVERMHRDLNQQVVNRFYNLFHEMEQSGYLNPENATDIFCLHYVFIPVINKNLHQFAVAHNNHKISTEHNLTPLQLFLLNYNIRETQRESDVEFNGGMALSVLDQNNLPYVDVPAIVSPLLHEEHVEMERSIDPLSYMDPVEAFHNVTTFVARCLTT